MALPAVLVFVLVVLIFVLIAGFARYVGHRQGVGTLLAGIGRICADGGF